jgi:probable DNA metabolism protein
MVIFRYDKSFEGLLCCVFEAYNEKKCPDMLLDKEETTPLFYDEICTIETDSEKTDRVWTGLKKRISASALHCVTCCWLADSYPKADEVIFRYIYKCFKSKESIETNFADADVLELSKIYHQISYENLRVKQFVRFQKTKDDIYFAAIEPLHNVLSMSIEHFRDRFATQKWIVYDTKRDYGYYYDLNEVQQISFSSDNMITSNGISKSIMAEDEKLFQDLWKTYFKAIAIKERKNPRKQGQDMPRRFWKYLTEKN